MNKFVRGGWIISSTWLKIIEFFNYCKIADLQAHSMAPSSALRACRSAIFENVWKCVQETYISKSVMLKRFHVKDPQNDMYLATDPHLKIFSSRDPPPEAKFELQMFA